jgi:hypothetical protein
MLTWGANHDFKEKLFTGLMNALCYCRETLPWPKILTIINIVQKLD